ncbi:hypothetical protein PICMEDRAFT_58630 [Pichia membranifaciens NRRL Y-2026]|uniref:Secreted protein n=1 Tax=Pichia membranifaciens NRRL Y-2026 TaxID=763406 RepID=A0A1E3NJG2_9ASCO|nr:hypothetical protein PICMEDRAFT_58630 [Pichia membranifaciens NRRL Y-2026]ODQ46282.1 hypothetical protein PICMEDRAFT_58630 [Pichia membranifaciens NRRL Y-2026]
MGMGSTWLLALRFVSPWSALASPRTMTSLRPVAHLAADRRSRLTVLRCTCPGSISARASAVWRPLYQTPATYQNKSPFQAGVSVQLTRRRPEDYTSFDRRGTTPFATTTT